ncbi:DUF3857 domain-containing protein [Flavobacterium sp.]|uniref:DUF3857 domain-containing protein n=1 Tax=Flavobacterium sp. TaxID=239 RepID=UPI0039E260D4
MRKTIALLLLAFAPLVHAQQPEEVKNYTWDATPNFRDVPEEFQSYPAVVLQDYRLYDNRVGEYTYKAFVVKHVAIKIQQPEGIKNYNTVNIDKRYVRDYRDLKARVIKSDGKIEELSKDRIIEKEESNERQFVFEGVQTGDIIEYYYVIKDYPDLSGGEYFQRRIPVMDAKFQLNNINRATTVVDAYNGMQKKSVSGYQIYTAKDLPAFKEEQNAANMAYVAKLYYRISSANDFGWEALYHSITNYAAGDNAKSMVRDFVEELQLGDTSIPLDERLKKMDIYLKENIALDRQDNYKKVFETKKITPRMVLYLYTDVLSYLKVPYRFIISTDKFENKFDSQKAVPAALSEIMIYIPETDKYLCPFDYWMPYGPPVSAALANEAVEYTPKNKHMTHAFVVVGGVSMKDNLTQTENDITLDNDMETVTVKKKKTDNGYRAYLYRNILKRFSEDKQKEMAKETSYKDVDVEIKKYSFENEAYKFNYEEDKPFTINTEAVIKESWVENAGRNYLVTIGKVLGKQNDLYQETERIHPIDLAYPKMYLHDITFRIPEGYTVKDIKNLLFNKKLHNEAGDVIGSFESKGTIEGGLIKIQIEEFYNFTHLEKDRYPEYRDLINAAYDFYKSSLILTKS